MGLSSRRPALFSAAPVVPMIYPLTLETAMLLVGVLLIVSHGLAWFQPESAQSWLKAFPRSSFWGTTLVVVAAAWFWWLVAGKWSGRDIMDLHEFSNWRPVLRIGTPIAAYLTWRYVPEFLSVRSLGMIVLLGAEALLEAAWMRPEMSRLWLTGLVYVWLTVAMFWVGMPYTLRDQIAWVSADRRRWNFCTLGGVAYGVLLLIVGVMLRR